MNKMAQVMKTLRIIHSYLGLIALPWVILFGVSGLYLNHPSLITNILPASAYSDNAEQFELLETPLSSEQAADIARAYFQDSPMKSIREIEYHGFDSIEFQREAGTIIVSTRIPLPSVISTQGFGYGIGTSVVYLGTE